MANVKEINGKVERMCAGFEGMLTDVLHKNAVEAEVCVREQLGAGVDGDDHVLRPSYLEDPWFDSPEAGSWRGGARRYMAWKMEITPPYDSSFLGITRRAPETPNLLIDGTFYRSIRATVIEKGLRIGSQGCDFAGDIEGKYGQQIYKIGRWSRKYFLEQYVIPGIEAYFRRIGR